MEPKMMMPKSVLSITPLTNWILIQLSVCCLTSVSAIAQHVEEVVPFKGEPLGQWIVVVENSTISVYQAELQKTLSALNITGTPNINSNDALLGAVVRIDSGEMYSSQLHKIGVNDLVTESSVVAREQLKDFQTKIPKLRSETAQLEDSVNVLNQKLRQESGLVEVDKIYEKIAVVDKQILEFQEKLDSKQ